MVIARRLSAYVARAVLGGILATWLLLFGIHLLIDFIREVRSLGGDYRPMQMLWYLLQTSPRRLYDVFPFAALIGTLLGLGGLASANELVAMRAAGFDRWHVAWRVLGVVSVCVLVMAAMAEWLIPDLETRARAERQQARSGQLHVGDGGQLWLRDGPFMIRLNESLWRDEEDLSFSDALVYRLDEQMRPQRILRAARAFHKNGEWLLEQVSYRDLESEDGMGFSALTRLPSRLSPELFIAAVSRPRLLAMSDLQQMRGYLVRNGLDASAYEQAFWQRAFLPLNVLAMVLVALPFVFMSGRAGQRSPGLFIGVVLGLMFFVLSRLTQSLAMVWPLPLWLSLLLPPLTILLLGMVLLRRL
ncbi:MAG: LPS export ABC transporter permease LptG [Wenzhouxiangella sp.]|jgi:lipopolysaccharide export system permease protein|nr:LPS export ABC transporter permease LptG [Wenzhouxiangella sp.]